MFEKQKQDQQLYASARSHADKQLVKNFCAMHLAVNLQSTFFYGMKQSDTSIDVATSRKRKPVDTLIHQFW